MQMIDPLVVFIIPLIIKRNKEPKVQSFFHLRLISLHEAHGEFPSIFFLQKKIIKQKKQGKFIEDKTKEHSIQC